MKNSHLNASKLAMSVMVLVGASAALADGPAPSAAPLATTKCEIMMVVKNQPGLDEKIEVPVKGPGHGGSPYTYKQGPFALEVSVDGQWMVITWMKDGKTIAAGEFVMAASATSPRVAIMTNPNDSEEQVSVGCDVGSTH